MAMNVALIFDSHFIMFLTTGIIYWPGVKRKPLFDEKMARRAAEFALKFLGVLLVCLIGTLAAYGQDQPTNKPSAQTTSAPPDDPVSDETPTMFPHSEWSRFWISGQTNFISQWHAPFHSPCQGPNSLPPEAQDATSRVLTLFTGLRLNHTAELLLDVQETGGHGIGEALGLAGFTNLDVVRNP